MIFSPIARVISLFFSFRNEINEEYYDSVRKAILDYVLKDENEKLRIGIMETYKPAKDYGENIYAGLEPDSETERGGADGG